MSIAALMLFQVSALLLREFARRKFVEVGIDASSAKHLSALVGFAVLAVLMAPLMASVQAVLAGFFRRPRSWFRLVSCSIAIGLCFRALDWAWNVTLIASGFYGPGDPTRSAGPLFWWSCPTSSYLALSITVMALMTPFVEELVNRGVILHTLAARGRFFGVIVSAALFAVLHTPENMLVALLFGIVAAIQMLYYRTLLGPIIAHATFNLMITLDWDCLNGIWIPASTSVAASAVASILALSMLLTATWLATRRAAGAK